jgi:hypothetical protein
MVVVRPQDRRRRQVATWLPSESMQRRPKRAFGASSRPAKGNTPTPRPTLPGALWEIARAIVALANRGGAHLLGVGDRGELWGLC